MIIFIAIIALLCLYKIQFSFSDNIKLANNVPDSKRGGVAIYQLKELPLLKVYLFYS